MPDASTPPFEVRALLGRFWTLANVLSLSRVVLVVPITLLVWRGDRLDLVLGLVVLGVLTDFFDGKVARWTNSVSEWGKVLDPLADKFAALCLVGALALRPVEPRVPLWLLALLLIRDGAIVAGGILLARRTGEVLMSMWWGKVAVGFVALTVMAVLLRADPPVLQATVFITAFLLVLSFVQYVFRFLRRYRAASASGAHT